MICSVMPCVLPFSSWMAVNCEMDKTTPEKDLSRKKTLDDKSQKSSDEKIIRKFPISVHKEASPRLNICQIVCCLESLFGKEEICNVI